MNPETCRIVGEFLAQLGGKWAVITIMVLSCATFVGNVTLSTVLAVILLGHKQQVQIRRRDVFLACVILVLLGSAGLTFAVDWAALEALSALRHQPA
jgi:putative Mn2+ efflux pump MntP